MVPLMMWLPITVSWAVAFKEEKVDAAALRAASLGAKTVNPLAPSRAAANDSLLPFEIGSVDIILLSIVRFKFVRTVEIGPGGVSTASIT